MFGKTRMKAFAFSSSCFLYILSGHALFALSSPSPLSRRKLRSIKFLRKDGKCMRRNFIRNLFYLGIVNGFSEGASAAQQAVLPDVGEIARAIPSDDGWEDNLPFDPATDFSRLDGSLDSKFYSETRFVEHVDENAVKLMEEYIAKELKDDDKVLDIGSSWTSHIRDASRLSQVSGIGMNEAELKTNTALTDFQVLDLNQNPSPKLPYPDKTFDVALCQLSIDYFVHPLELMKETSRVLRQGGKVIILFSNRLFLSKAVGVWTGADDIDHAYTVGAYLHYCGDICFESISAYDLSLRSRGKVVGDPLYAVVATKT